METRSEYERVLRRQLGRLVRKLRQRQEALMKRGFSEAQARWFEAKEMSDEEGAALAALSPQEAFICGAIFVYEVAIDEVYAATSVARLAARIEEPSDGA